MRPLAVGLAATALFTPLVVWLAHRWRLIDVPNHRSSHAAPVPRGGGLAVAVGAVVALATSGSWELAALALVLCSVALGATGLLDDRFGLPPVPRLLVQLVAPAVAAAWVVDAAAVGRLAAAAVAALVCASYVNAFNFMDGINGISGTQAAIAGGWLAYLGDRTNQPLVVAAGLAIAGACLGFLPYNLPCARIFLGDVGSYFIGVWLAGLALLAIDRGISPLTVAAPFLLYLLDTSTVLVRRARRGDRLMEAHREHAYQRLVAAGRSHAAVASVCAAFSLACCALAAVAVDASTWARLAASVGAIVVVAVYLVLPSRLGRADSTPGAAG